MSTDPAIRELTDKINGMVRGFMASQVIFAANEGGVFPLLEEERTAGEVAAETGWHPRGARMLLDGLVALELVSGGGGKYRNGPIASACLVPGGPAYQGHLFRHMHHMADRWARLEESLRSGTGLPREGGGRTTKELRSFILGMKDISALSAKDVVAAVDLSPYRNMLDLGGGPATHAITFAQAHREMRATVFDRPDVIEIAREEAANAGLTDRIGFVPGDMTEDLPGTGFDFIFISNIVHCLGLEANRALVRKCYDAMVPGGLLLIKDFLVDNDRSGPPFSLMFALNMLLGTEEGDTYTLAQAEAWTREAGFGEGRAVDLTAQTRLWLAHKPGARSQE